jgi:hypothetical protein
MRATLFLRDLATLTAHGGVFELLIFFFSPFLSEAES